jgi:hypothetical protein
MGDNLVPIGLSRGCKIFGSKSPILIEEADGAKTARFCRGHSWHGHYRSARCFRRQSRAPRGAPLTGKGIDRSARPSKGGLSCQECQKSPPLLIRTGDIGDNLGAERVVERLQGPLLELDVAEIVVHEADEPNVIVDLLNAKCLTGERG